MSDTVELAPPDALDVGLPFYLQSVPEIAALCSDRVYGMRRPQRGDTADQLPAIMVTRTQTSIQEQQCGPDDLVEAAVQIDCFAMGASVFALAKAVRDALKGFSGGMMGSTYVTSAQRKNEFPVDDPDPGVVRITLEYTVFYQEA